MFACKPGSGAGTGGLLFSLRGGESIAFLRCLFAGGAPGGRPRCLIFSASGIRITPSLCGGTTDASAGATVGR